MALFKSYRSFLMGLILPLCFISLMSVTSAEEDKHRFKAPDYTAIQKAIKDKTSPYYYPKLMERLITFDPDLTDEEYRHLYYGYRFNEHYHPYTEVSVKFGNSEQVEAYNALKAVIDKQPSDLKAIQIASEQYFRQYPFDMTVINVLSHFHSEQKNYEAMMKLHNRVSRLIITIMGSGNGMSCENAMHVLFVNHQYLILNSLKFAEGDLIRQSLLNEGCDFHQFNREREKFKHTKINGLYFDVKALGERFKSNMENELGQ